MCTSIVTRCLKIDLGVHDVSETVVEAFRRSRVHISQMLGCAFSDDPTNVMEAVNSNAGSQVCNAISDASCSVRAQWMPTAQGGPRSIAPLDRSIECAARNAAYAMFEGLRTLLEMDDTPVEVEDVVKDIFSSICTL